MSDRVQRGQHVLPGIEPVIVFLSCAPEDDEIRARLERHVAALEHDGRIRLFHEGRIACGTHVQTEVEENLRSARIVLFVVSADFIHAKCSEGTEVEFALERQRRGEAKVIPVLARPCDLTSSPFRDIQPLPSDGRPISQHKDPEKALWDIAVALREEVDGLSANVGACRDATGRSPVTQKRAGEPGGLLDEWRSSVTRIPRAGMLAAMGLVVVGGVAMAIGARHLRTTTTEPSFGLRVGSSAGSVAVPGPPLMNETRPELPFAKRVPSIPSMSRVDESVGPSRPSPTPSVDRPRASTGASALTPGVSSVRTGNLVVGDGGRVAVGNRKGGMVDVETGAVTIGDDAGASVGNVTQAEAPARNGVRVRTGDVKGGDGATIEIGNVD